MPYLDHPVFWFPKSLTYGNYGGPGWSGGEFQHDRAKIRWEVNPSDDMDVLFYDHDYAWNYAKHVEDLRQADQTLIDSLRRLDPDPRKWHIPPTRNSLWWARFYRHAAILVFRTKLCLGL